MAKPASPITFSNGKAEWTSQKDDKFHVTGVDRSGKRFKIVSENWHYASGINLWRGTVWLIRNGFRFRIRTVFN